MNVLITGAAGNLGSLLAWHLLEGPHHLRLLIHRKDLPTGIAARPNVTVHRADLANPDTLRDPLKGVDAVVHFAGVLFAPWPERFLPKTNVGYVRNLMNMALQQGAKKFILISFPHVEGESFPSRPAKGLLEGNPSSVHAKTRLAAEKYLFEACRGNRMLPISLRSGMIYGKGVLMIEAARWLLKHHLLAVWRKPTWIHLLSLPDFLSCVKSALEKDGVLGIYNLGDDRPTTLQEFLDALAIRWGYSKPWRFPRWLFYAAAGGCEAFAAIFKTKSPLTRDFIRIGMASYVSDTSRMKQKLLAALAYPDLKAGSSLL